ncbi:MAG: hypothetical protein WBC91_18700 [Phototrophicaceae bacterium]
MLTTQGLWDNEEHTCYRIEFYEGWSWEDFGTIHKEKYAMLGKLEQHIDLIVLFLGRVPRGSSMGHLSAGGDQPPNIRHTVMVNATDLTTKIFVKSMIGSIVQLHNWVGPHFVDSLEEARLYLAQLEQSSDQ